MSQIDNFLSGGGGGSTQIYYTVNKPQLDNLIQNNLLVKGATYKISGVHTGTEGVMPLYYDGETVGVTVILEAVANNKLSLKGTGIFYNPIYNVEAPNASMWNADSTYNTGETVFYGGYAWLNLNGNVGVAVNQITLNEEWEKIPYSNTDYYVVAYDEIDYDYQTDLIIRRYESLGNNEVTCSLFSYYLMNNDIGGIFIHPISLFKWGYPINFFAVYGISNIKIEDSVFNCINSPARLLYDINLSQNCVFNNVESGVNTIINGLYLKNVSKIINCNIFGGFYQINLNINSNIENTFIDNDSNIYQISIQNNSSLSDSSLTNSTISNLHIKDGATFNNNVLNNTTIYGLDMYYLSSFVNCTFNNNTQIKNIILYQQSKINILNSTGNCIIQNINFNQESKIEEVSFTNNCRFSEINLGQKTSITNLLFGENVVFSSNQIGMDSVIANTNFNINSSFRNNTAIDSLYINNTTLSEGAKIEKCVFNNTAILSSVTLNNSVYLIDNIFENNSQILNTTIPQSITNTIFEQKMVIDSLDLSSATLIYSIDPKNVFILPNGSVKVRMYDNLGLLNTTDILL